jgi:hypothetical protein
MRRCGQQACQRAAEEDFVILNLFQDNAPPSFVILKQVQDDGSSR